MGLPPGTITTVAGGGTAPLTEGGKATDTKLGPRLSIAADAAGNLYIADRDAHHVLRVSKGLIHTLVADTDAFRIAVDAAGSAVYLSEFSHNRVRKSVNGAAPVLVAGDENATETGDGGPAVKAALDLPLGLALDKSGNLFIMESGAERVRKVDTQGIIHTVAAKDGKHFLGEPEGIALGAAGDVYTAPSNWKDKDSKLHLLKATQDGTWEEVAGGGSTKLVDGTIKASELDLGPVSDLATGPSGDVYFVNNEQHQVLRLHVAEQTVSLVAGNGSDQFSGDDGPAVKAGLDSPMSIAVDASGNLYIAEYELGRVRMVTQVD